MLPNGNRCPASNKSLLLSLRDFLCRGDYFFLSVSSAFLLHDSFATLLLDSTLDLARRRLPRTRAMATILGDDDLGARLSTRETNPARPGYYLWGAGQGFAITRRGENRGQGYGSDPIWKRYPLAPRRR